MFNIIVEPLDLINSINGNDDPNARFHIDGMICPGALIISNLENIVNAPILGYDASIQKLVSVAKPKILSFNKHDEFDKYIVKDGVDNIGYISLKQEMRGDLLQQFQDQTYVKWNFELFEGHFDNFCLSIHQSKKDLLKKYNNNLPPIFAAYLFVKPIQEFAEHDKELNSVVSEISQDFPVVHKIYRKQCMNAIPDNLLSSRFGNLDIDIARGDYKIRELRGKGKIVTADYYIILNNEGIPSVYGKNVAAVTFQPKLL